MQSKDPLPYIIHTNREFGMMLRGEKPLAAFCRRPGQSVPYVERYFRMFDRHVRTGRFIKEEKPHALGAHVIAVYYALPGNEWRIEALHKLRAQETWSLDDERREGELLGYADWQNDIWIERCRLRSDAS